MGLGTRTNIYAGVLKMKSEDDDDFGGYGTSQEVKVVLKVLGSGHRDISLVRPDLFIFSFCLFVPITLSCTFKFKSLSSPKSNDISNLANPRDI